MAHSVVLAVKRHDAVRLYLEAAFAALLATQKGRQVVVWVGWVGLCIRVHLISASLSSQAKRNKEWEAAKRIHGLVRKPFRQTLQHECKAAGVIKWVWCEINGCHSALGMREGEKGREGREREGKREKKKEKRKKVAPREVEESSAPDRAEPFCDTEWDERGFWQYNFFSSLPFFFPSLPCCLHPFYLTSSLPPFGFAFDLLFAVFLITNGKEGE